MLLLRLLKKNALWLLLLPVLTACTVYYFTRNQPEIYRSTATVYTGLASGYSILSEGTGGRVSGEVIYNEFDNLSTIINSQETLAQVGTHLLARHLQLADSQPLVLGKQGYNRLESIKKIIEPYLIEGANQDNTFLRLDSLVHAKGTNPVKDLILKGGSYYSVNQIKSVQNTRKSDMLHLEYKSEDAAVAQATLNLLIQVFRERYSNFKSSEAGEVVKYYSSRTRDAEADLGQAEESVKSFGVKNKIIDYGQQSSTAAASKAGLTNDYNKELMQYQAAKAAMATLGMRMSDRASTLANNEALVTKQEEIVKVQTQLANARNYGQPNKVVGDLESKLSRLTADMKVIAAKHYDLGNTTESIAQRTLVDEWLRKVLAYEESAARLNVYEKQIKELDNTTRQLTPLGSTLKQLNRNADVAEKDYLDNLSELNKAQARLKNAEMEGPLTVLDEPDFPMSPMPSTQWKLVAAGVGTGLFLALALILLKYFLDKRINTPQRAETLTGLPISVVFPWISGKSSKAIRVANATLEQLRSNIAVELRSRPHRLSYTLIGVVSSRPKQGKTWLGLQLAEQYAQAGHRVVYCFPQGAVSPSVETPNLTFVDYTISAGFIDTPDIETLLSQNAEGRPIDYDIVLLELSSLMTHAIPAYLVAQVDASILVVSARSSWTREDSTLLALYQRATTHSLIAVLNQTDLDLINITPVAEQLSIPVNVIPRSRQTLLPERVKSA